MAGASRGRGQQPCGYPKDVKVSHTCTDLRDVAAETCFFTGARLFHKSLVRFPGDGLPVFAKGGCISSSLAGLTWPALVTGRINGTCRLQGSIRRALFKEFNSEVQFGSSIRKFHLQRLIPIRLFGKPCNAWLRNKPKRLMGHGH
jgi:hypothetical protein